MLCIAENNSGILEAVGFYRPLLIEEHK